MSAITELPPVEIFIVVISHVLAWPSIRYWMVYRKVQWKKGPTGKALFNKARSLAVLLVISLVGFWWPWPGYRYVYAAALVYLTVAVWYQYRVMRRLVKQALPEKTSSDDLPCTHERIT